MKEYQGMPKGRHRALRDHQSLRELAIGGLEHVEKTVAGPSAQTEGDQGRVLGWPARRRDGGRKQRRVEMRVRIIARRPMLFPVRAQLPHML